MDKDEQRYFDEKFGAVHKRITDTKEAQSAELHLVTNDQNQKIADLKESIETHKVESSTHDAKAIAAAAAAARKAVEDHKDESWMHNPTKTWKLLAAISGFLTFVCGLLMWALKHFKP